MKVARELGRAAFARFTGPAAVDVFADPARFWTPFHGWGAASARVGPGRAVIAVSGAIDPLLCVLVEGGLERMAELAGATGAHATHAHGDPCRFEVSWTV
jgi:hypothetical protein